MPFYEPKTELEMNLDRMKHDRETILEELKELNELIEKYEKALEFLKGVK